MVIWFEHSEDGFCNGFKDLLIGDVLLSLSTKPTWLGLENDAGDTDDMNSGLPGESVVCDPALMPPPHSALFCFRMYVEDGFYNKSLCESSWCQRAPHAFGCEGLDKTIPDKSGRTGCSGRTRRWTLFTCLKRAAKKGTLFCYICLFCLLKSQTGAAWYSVCLV